MRSKLQFVESYGNTFMVVNPADHMMHSNLVKDIVKDPGRFFGVNVDTGELRILKWSTSNILQDMRLKIGVEDHDFWSGWPLKERVISLAIRLDGHTESTSLPKDYSEGVKVVLSTLKEYKSYNKPFKLSIYSNNDTKSKSRYIYAYAFSIDYTQETFDSKVQEILGNLYLLYK